jgi:8-oxo-dGTP diphosphatase
LKEIFVVAGILINHDKSILLAQRSAEKSFPSQWEFPGGKIEEGENSESALRRELFEELNIEVDKMKLFDSMIHEYELFRANIEFFLVKEWSGNLLNKEGQNLQWKKLNDLRGLKILDADVPVISKLITIYG